MNNQSIDFHIYFMMNHKYFAIISHLVECEFYSLGLSTVLTMLIITFQIK